MEGAPQRRLLRSGWSAIGLSVVVAGLAWVSFDASHARVDDADTRVAAELGRLTEARSTFERSAVEVLVHHLLVGVDLEGDADAATAAWGRATDAVDELRSLASGTGAVAERAQVVVDALDDAGIGELDGSDLVDPDSAALSAVYTAIDEVRWSDERLHGTTRLDAAFDLSFTATLPDQILIEALAAWADVEERAIDPALEGIYGEVTVVVRNDGGWLAEDPDLPLAESDWFDLEQARDAFPRQTAAVEQAIVATDLIEVDSWMRELDDSSTPPPVSVEGIVPSVVALRAELADLVDQVLTDEIAAAADDARSRPAPDAALLIMAATGALVALVLLVDGIRRILVRRRSVRRLSDLALRDALTGAGNRHALDPHTRAALADATYRHHALVVVDLDRFKMVNDVYGHAAGDAVLVEVAERLRAAVAAVVAAAAGTRGHVVRMGGDEFLVSVHGPEGLPVDVLVEHLDAARRHAFTVGIDGRTEELVPEFSYGVVECEGTGALDELMVTADLAAYADKSRRAAHRRDGAAVAAPLAPPPGPAVLPPPR